jgi:hypothetical protein
MRIMGIEDDEGGPFRLLGVGAHQFCPDWRSWDI